ncbi:MAG: hypothetical protein ABI200_06765, partial [Gaiellales bacterium]
RVLATVARIVAELRPDAGVATAELVGLAPETAVAALRYACTRLGAELHAAADPSLEAAADRADRGDRALD